MPGVRAWGAVSILPRTPLASAALEVLRVTTTATAATVIIICISTPGRRAASTGRAPRTAR